VLKKLMIMATAAVLLAASPALAQPWSPPPGSDPEGYYSRSDHDGYYDRHGQYRRYSENQDNSDMGPPPPAYRQGAYEDNCRRGNHAAGTLFGALAGGLIGDAASHGRGGAVIGGAILGGMLGNAITSDIPCEDHPYAFRAYATGLNGDLGRRYEWRHGESWGYFTPQTEFHRGRTVCRSWSETTYARGHNYTRSGTACRQTDGNWRFDD
jgi:surface antigen